MVALLGVTRRHAYHYYHSHCAEITNEALLCATKEKKNGCRSLRPVRKDNGEYVLLCDRSPVSPVFLPVVSPPTDHRRRLRVRATSFVVSNHETLPPTAVGFRARFCNKEICPAANFCTTAAALQSCFGDKLVALELSPPRLPRRP